MNTGFRKRRRALVAATSGLFLAAGIAVVSVAGAAQDTKIYVSDTTGKSCFAAAKQAPCTASFDVTVQTGDTVTWDFAGATMPHNVASRARNPSDPPDDVWKAFQPRGNPPYHNPGSDATDSFTFGKAGVYRYVCQIHPGMEGTITVTGEQVETPTPDPDEEEDGDENTPETPDTPKATFVPAATATPDNHTSTPAPGHTTAKDTEAPRLQRASVKKVATGAKLRFWLSEPAQVSIALVRKGAKSSTASTVVQAPAGTRSFVLRTRALRKGTYTVTLAPVDAMGNKGARGVKTLKVAK